MDNNTKKYLKSISKNKNFKKIIEIGSLDVNGEIKSLFENFDIYHGVDIAKGKNVDIVGHFASASVQEKIEKSYDLIICCNVLEHDKNWRNTFECALKKVDIGGVIAIVQPTTISLNNFYHINKCSSIVQFPSSWENGRVEYISEYFEGNVSDQILIKLSSDFQRVSDNLFGKGSQFPVQSKHISYSSCYYISHNIHYTKNNEHYSNVKLGEILEIMAANKEINKFHIEADLELDSGLQYNITLTRHSV